MRRVRQESAEVYEISPAEVARALGLYFCDGDQVTIEHAYGDVYKLRVAAHTEESIEIEVPVADPLGVPTMIEIPLVMIPPPFAPEADLYLTNREVAQIDEAV